MILPYWGRKRKKNNKQQICNQQIHVSELARVTDTKSNCKWIPKYADRGI
jgi:hypothetical protein